MHDPLASNVAQAAVLFTNILQKASGQLKSQGHVSAMADFRTELDAALHHYMKEHTTFHLRREAMLARQLVCMRQMQPDCNQPNKRPRIEAEIKRCYGEEMLDWVSKISTHSDNEKNVVGRARLWHAALLDRNFEMVYRDTNNNILMRRGSANSPIKV